jgi:hypothetical protein
MTVNIITCTAMSGTFYNLHDNLIKYKLVMHLFLYHQVNLASNDL